MLLPYMKSGLAEAGCDEAGRGCLAGSVYAAAVILPPHFRNELLNDSKQLSEKQRYELRPIIEQEAVACHRYRHPRRNRPHQYSQCFVSGHAPGYRTTESATAASFNRR